MKREGSRCLDSLKQKARSVSLKLLPRVLDKRKEVIVLSSSGENLELWVTNLDRKNPGGIIAIQGNRKYVK